MAGIHLLFWKLTPAPLYTYRFCIVSLVHEQTRYYIVSAKLFNNFYLLIYLLHLAHPRKRNARASVPQNIQIGTVFVMISISRGFPCRCKQFYSF